jgi:hypothetical protein
MGVVKNHANFALIQNLLIIEQRLNAETQNFESVSAFRVCKLRVAMAGNWRVGQCADVQHCLQVHMGTHMWNNGASRRGRRMSLDLPPIPMTPKDSEFLQRRPDLFYPYLPAPFLNGMQQKVSTL